MTPSEIARKIAERLCIDDMIRAHHRKAVAAIIEPEVRELVEKLRLTELALAQCRARRQRDLDWRNDTVARLELADGTVFTRQQDGKCVCVANGFSTQYESLNEALMMHYAIGGGSAALTQPKEPDNA